MSIPRIADYSLPTSAELPTNKVDWTFDPARAVLLIHDMQEYFLDFWAADSMLIQRVVDNLKALRQFCHRSGIPVFYTAQPVDQKPEDRRLLNDMWGAGLNDHPERAAIVDALAPTLQDTVLTKWRYSAFQRSLLEVDMKSMGRDQLIIGGVYAHIGCMMTACDAFMRDIQPFFVSDALADFSREDHDMALRYVAGRCGSVTTTQRIAPVVVSFAQLRAQVVALLDDDGDDVENDDNLIDFGLDSIRMMNLAAQWNRGGHAVDFTLLAREPTLAAWWALLSASVHRHTDEAALA
ncbi:isochorismatase family protein [Zymobacter palmae]|uniref:isochorismatase n=1 Tax=Zymobacter palmae TaxID=33074 RepID=A0A348HEP3_9GAMM|nr:isochorismatase family protein [Zymobacter palmae]BBG30095.1 isochorismate hydrolase [Zymobacter palmae]